MEFRESGYAIDPAAFVSSFLAILALSDPALAEITIELKDPSPPPFGRIAQRDLIKANAAACEIFFDHYFDDRGWLEWSSAGGATTDRTTPSRTLPIGRSSTPSAAPIRSGGCTRKVGRGTFASTPGETVNVPMARDGMYYKEFPVMFDWLHNGEGLTVFNLMGLGRPP